jgi:hypothetical protein
MKREVKPVRRRRGDDGLINKSTLRASNTMGFEEVAMRLDDRERAEGICRSAAKMGGRPESGDLTISLKEAEALLKEWVEHIILPDFGAFVTGCYGGQRMLALALAGIDDIKRLFGAAVVRDWYKKGKDEFAWRQDPTLWRMYQQRVEPARDRKGLPLEPIRPATLTYETLQ